MITTNQLDAVFQEIVNQHIQLKGYYSISPDKMDIDNIAVDKYPFLYAQVSNADIDEGGTTFTYDLIVADLVIEANQDINQVLGDTQLIIQDVLAQFIFSGASQQFIAPEYVIELPVACTPIQYEFNNSVTGWRLRLDVRVKNATTLCDALFTSGG